VKTIMNKRILRIAILWFGPLVVAVVGGYLWLHGGRYATTDNAYVKSSMISIASELSGRVVEVFGADNQRVEAGEVLLRIDDEVYRIRLAEAEANILKVRSNIESLRADYLNKQADIEKAEADIAKAEADAKHFESEFERLQKLKEINAVSAIQVDQAEYQADQARQEVDITRKELNITRQALQVVEARLVDPNLPSEEHPDYKLALAQRDKAALDLTKIEVRAPTAGILANFDVKVGEVLNASVPLFSLVDDSRIWVDANFKETDLTYMREGQEATIEVDTYPGLEWRGKVYSITPGTGSEFSLLPAQNSSGNWVKVVQRVSVTLEMEPLADAPPLRAGLSAVVKVDTKHQRKAPWNN
jgi:membrane fusion protein (multidrug efflux system)